MAIEYQNDDETETLSYDYSSIANGTNKLYFIVKQNINPYLDLSQQLLLEALEEIEQIKE